MSTPRSLVLPDRVRHRMVTTERGTFAALEARPDRGVCERRPALLVPGYTGSKEDFLPVLAPLAAAGRRVIAVDQRGQYESPGTDDPDGYLPDSLAADLTAIARQIAAADPGVHLLGHSFGGLIARHAMLADATVVLSLTLLDSGPASIGGLRAEILRSTLEHLSAKAALPGAGRPPPGTAGSPAGTGPRLAESEQQRLRDGIEHLWEERIGPQAAADGVPPPVLAFLRRRMLRNCPVGLIMMARCLLDCPDRTMELAALPDARILVIYGENDDAWLPGVQEAMARQLRARRVCIPAAAHSPAVEAPATTAAALTAFWSEAERDERWVDNRQPGAEPGTWLLG